MINSGFGDITQHALFVGRRFGTPFQFHPVGRSDQIQKVMDVTDKVFRNVGQHIYITLGNIPKTRINYYYFSQKDRRAKAGDLQQNSRSALSAVGDPT